MNTRTKIEDAATEEMAALSSEIGKLRDDIKSMIENVGRMGRERADAIAHSEPVTEGLAAGEAALAGIATELRALEKDILKSARRSPWRALGIAAVLGIVVGLILRR